MSMEQQNKKNDHTILVWLLVCMLVLTIIATSFAVWRTSISRAKWFEFSEQMDSQGVNINAKIVAKQCGARSVKYGWRWEGKNFEGNGWSCNATCADAKLGDEVQVRFIPTNPKIVNCVPEDISRMVGPPKYIDSIIFVLILLVPLWIPIIRYGRSESRG